jgi:hypothetical protein
MNQYLKVISIAFFYGLLTLGVWKHWWVPDVLLTSIYTGMTALGGFASIHYGAKYLQYNKSGQLTQNPTIPLSEK